MQAVRTGRKGGLEDFGIDSFERRKAAFFRRWGWKFLPFSQTDPLPHPKLMVPHQTEEVMKLVDLIREGDLVTFVVSDLGMGKTTLCRYLSEVLPLRDPNLLTVFIPAQSIQTPEQMLRVLLSRLEMEAGGDLTEEFEKFYRWHQSYPESKLVVFVDEFPELDVKVAEMIRALADLRNISWVLNGRKDQILAYLQEHVPSLLSRKRYMLEMKPLSLEEVQELILLRMAWARGESQPRENSLLPFTPASLRRIHRLSGGVPREVLKLASEAVYSAIEKNLSRIPASLIGARRKPRKRVRRRPRRKRSRRKRRAAKKRRFFWR
ncbi:MAG: ATP-binding protein [Hadesarchaea archaeon]|jgi:general secretion pathway protein A|nr:ATP-binding protein [Hadesarchaea archaeon]